MDIRRIGSLYAKLVRDIFLNKLLTLNFIYYFLKYFMYLFIYFLKRFYLCDRETASERGNTSRGSGRGRSRHPVEKHDVGLDPTMPGSCPEPKADA